MRLFTDWKLIWEASPFWIVLLAVIGFLIGVILAHHYWYRSARRLRLAREENDRLTRESREWGNQSRGVEVPASTLAAVDLEPEDTLVAISRHQKIPHDAEDLTLLEGVDSGTAAKMNAAGIYKRSQWEALDDGQRSALATKFHFSGIDWSKWNLSGDTDVHITTDELPEGHPVVSETPEISPIVTGDLPEVEPAGLEIPDYEVKPEEEFSIASPDSTAPLDADDLTLLEGIDAATAQKLNDAGIYKFDQLEGFDEEQRLGFASKFGFPEINWGSWGLLWGGATVAGLSAAASGEESSPVSTETSEPTLPSDLNLALDPTKTASSDANRAGFFGVGEDESEDSAVVYGAPKKGGGPRRVVLIMDVSKSLSDAQMKLSKSELSSAISSLPSGSLYQVIFFSGATWFAHQRMTSGGQRGQEVIISDGAQMYKWSSSFTGYDYEKGNDSLPTGEWKEATATNIAATLEDVRAVRKSYGTTWHLPLTMALSLEPAPRTIYFLTDGETARQDEVAEEMIELCRSRGNPKVHTISLMEPKASRPLSRLAKETGATFTLVIGGGKLLRDEELHAYLAQRGIQIS
ncbi:MAG: hypothetical protein KA250_10360 [Verrucomicrobiales bacterium]|jgi:predicted flap endonuclease-1-like 5' DNA nuclease|nr:hypothetical protein [Verrucomicrobiales bacterium]MBP9224254.1 hypothetical protein [Verrucomicrobiales bacterium]HQZ28184.1 hypothetical protein [Verrucomicrobiales bacterium]